MLIFVDRIVLVTWAKTDSDFNPYHRLKLANRLHLFNYSAPFFVRFSCVMRRSDRLVLRSGPLACRISEWHQVQLGKHIAAI